MAFKKVELGLIIENNLSHLKTKGHEKQTHQSDAVTSQRNDPQDGSAGFYIYKAQNKGQCLFRRQPSSL
jgi:hypothetical protein